MVGHSGAARLALLTGAPVIPIGQWGANIALPDNNDRPFRLRRHPITIICGEPVDLSEFSKAGSDIPAIRAATVRILDAITALVELARGEIAPDRRWDPKSQRRVPPNQGAR